jgi:multiple sugar transport system substrate-binding protein
MTGFTRRDTLKIGAGALAGTTLLGYRPAFGEVMAADVPAPKFQVEKGAELRVLRPAKFVQGDETLFLQNTERFTQTTGIKVRVDNESWEDLRPKTAVAANIGSGPDVVLAWNDDPHQYPDKLLDLTEVAEYLGKKYGGWYPIAERYGKGTDGKWIAMPIGASGGAIVYRKSWVNQAGYETVPTDIDNFLKLAQNLKKNNHPMGFALGNAQGDGNTWTHWLIWAHGGAMVDEKNKVIIDSPQTVAALE